MRRSFHRAKGAAPPHRFGAACMPMIHARALFTSIVMLAAPLLGGCPEEKAVPGAEGGSVPASSSASTPAPAADAAASVAAKDAAPPPATSATSATTAVSADAAAAPPGVDASTRAAPRGR
jgi:hypothetical protein